MEPFIAAWKDAVMKNYANFAGRLSVGGYWRYFAVSIGISIVLYILGLAASIFFILYILYALATIVPAIAAGIRRLHDIGKPGVNILIGLIPFVGFIILIVWFVKAGDVGDNAYGPPPVA